jgi:alkanesulfonate monooxygenase SsuD/methylene tetrahydromethanopterin reductase-like flavin-dependent oxidoreductase (luciferase family)
MKFALFYEIPVPKPRRKNDEYEAYQAVLEEAIFAEQAGFHAFWTVEHHFLEEYSHCSNPEVLYGAIASRTKKMRLAYGVRLMPKPYNHPIRTAESVAVLDLISSGRVDMGTGRSSTRQELEGFDINPGETREMWREALEHVVGCWTNETYRLQGKYWNTPVERPVLPKPYQKPHPPLWAATSSEGGHATVGSLGLGLCSFAVGTPPEDIQKRIEIYRENIKTCKKPIGKFINNQAATFTMVCCAPTVDEAVKTATPSFEWYPVQGAELIGSVANWMQEAKRDDELDKGNYDYTRDLKAVVDSGAHKLLSMDYLRETNACVVGDPKECVRMFKAYERAGVDLILCLVNPHSIPHDKVMQTIDLMGKEVLPHFATPS